MTTTTKKAKNLDLTEDCIHNLTVEAAMRKTDFKNLSQDILEKIGGDLSLLNKVLGKSKTAGVKK